MSEIREWLARLGLGKHAETFEANEVDLDALPHLTERMLKEMGLPIGARAKLMAALDTLEIQTPIEDLADQDSQPRPANVPQTGSDAERRQLTVMFCDLVGSTALSEQLDPEDLRTLMVAYQQAATAVIERFDGHVAQYLGDGMMVYFGWPHAHEDDAERSIHAALDIVDAVKSVRAPNPLQVHIGIATGAVVVGDTGGGDPSVAKAAVGETPNIASRLQALAGADEIVVGPMTHRLAGGAFEYDDLGARQLRGVVEPVPAKRVTGESAAEGRFEAQSTGGLTSLVGRDTEIAMLMDRWAQAKDGEGQVVLLSGEPGIGKSRITQVLRDQVATELHVRLRYQCSPYYSNSAFYPFIDQLERAAGFDRDDSSESKLDKLEAILEPATQNKETVAALIGAMLSLPIDRYPPLNLEPIKQKEMTITALSDLLDGLAQQQPVLIIFEDAHWIDPTSLDAVSAVIDRAQNIPVLLVLTYRPEFEPPWAGHGHVTTLALNRLSRRQGAHMVDRLTGGKSLPTEVLDQIVAKTDGVPLFVEELTKTVLESGVLTEQDDRFMLDGPLPPLAIPTTLQDSLLARLDRLSPVKEIAQIGACIGREFSYELLAAVAPLRDNELQDSLSQLVNSELVFRRGTPPDATFSFKHALVQDAAYESLLKSRRQQLHTTIAQTLEVRFPDQVASEPELAALHYTNAGLNDRAVPHWLAAGQYAVGRFANPEANAHLTKGLELLAQLPESRERDEQELAFRTTQGFALINYKSYATPECGEAYGRAWELCQRINDTSRVLPVVFGMSLFYLVKGDYPTSNDMAVRCLRMAQDANDTGGMVLGHTIICSAALFRGNATKAREHAAAGFAIYDHDEHRSLADVFGQNPGPLAADWGSWANWLLGYPDKAARLNAKSIQLAKECNHPLTFTTELAHAGIYDWFRRDVEAALAHAKETMVVSEEVGIPFRYIEGVMLEGWALAEKGEAVKGIAQIQQGVDSWRGINAEIALPMWLALLAEAYRRNGQIDDALSALDEAFEVMERIDERIWEPELHRLKGLFQVESDPVQPNRPRRAIRSRSMSRGASKPNHLNSALPLHSPDFGGPKAKPRKPKTSWRPSTIGSPRVSTLRR